MGQGPGKCRDCHQRVLWVSTGQGKSMPVDPVPRPDGNVAVWRSPEDLYVGNVITAEKPARANERVHMVHYATCARRPRPKTVSVTPENAAQVARRVRRDPAPDTGLFGELPDNVVPFRPKISDPT